MVPGAGVRVMALVLSVSPFCQPLAAQETEDLVTSVAKTADGAVYEERMGVDGTLVTESYLTTRLTCWTGKSAIEVMLPIARDDSLPQDGSTLREDKGVWHFTLRAGKTKIDKTAHFAAIKDKISLLAEGTVISIDHGDPVWKALIDPRGDQLLALTGGYGEFQSVSDDANLKAFEKICGLKR